MKKTVRMIAMLVAIVSIVSAMSVSAHAISDVSSIVSPVCTTLYIDDVEAAYVDLIARAYNIDRDMTVIDYYEMPDQVQVKYVQSEYGICINAYLDPMGEEKFDTISDGTELCVFYTLAGYSFVLTEDGLVCWCKSKLLANSFDARLSAENNRALDARNGIYG